MNSVIWLLAVVLAAVAGEPFGQDDPRESDLRYARPEVVEAFKSLLNKALGSEGTYHRDLLITAGIVPVPTGYESPKDEGTGTPKEYPISTEMYEHFQKHISAILSSLEKLDNALNLLFGERLLSSQLIGQEVLSSQKLAQHLKSYKSKSKLQLAVDSLLGVTEASTEVDCKSEENSLDAACQDRLSEFPELPSLPEVDFVMTSESGLSFENEVMTTTSVVDEITTEYNKFFSEIPESSVPTSVDQVPISEQDDGVTLTPFDEDFIMSIMSNSVSLEDLSDRADKSTDTEEAKPTDFIPTSDNYEIETPETASTHSSPKYGRVLTIEEVQLLDRALNLQPEFKYEVISSPQPDMDTLSDVHFLTSEENSSSKPIVKKRRRINPRSFSPKEPIFYQSPTPQKMIMRYYRDIPDTNFTCENKTIPGFYADEETDCQVFHVCWPGRRESFLCPVGSLFNQEVLSCDNFNHTNCSLTHSYFDLNTAFQEYDYAVAHNVTPRPDPMLKPIQNDSGTTEVIVGKPDIVELFEADLHFSEMVTKVNITELWDYVPVKAKVFVYPEPADVKEYLARLHHQQPHKIRKSKDVREQESATESEEDADFVLEEITEKRQRIEDNIFRVLKKLSRKHRD